MTKYRLKKAFTVTFLLFISAQSVAKENPFAGFEGTWTLKDNKFQTAPAGKEVEILEIENHQTKCEEVNTNKSIFCKSDWGDFKGHYLWTYNSDELVVHQLSHFGASRNGVGTGAFDDKRNLRVTVRFQDDPKGIYRVYEYIWNSKNEYQMISKQYDKDKNYTGDWYGGIFIRVFEK